MIITCCLSSVPTYGFTFEEINTSSYKHEPDFVIGLTKPTIAGANSARTAWIGRSTMLGELADSIDKLVRGKLRDIPKKLPLLCFQLNTVRVTLRGTTFCS